MKRAIMATLLATAISGAGMLSGGHTVQAASQTYGCTFVYNGASYGPYTLTQGQYQKLVAIVPSEYYSCTLNP